MSGASRRPAESHPLALGGETPPQARFSTELYPDASHVGAVVHDVDPIVGLFKNTTVASPSSESLAEQLSTASRRQSRSSTFDGCGSAPVSTAHSVCTPKKTADSISGSADACVTNESVDPRDIALLAKLCPHDTFAKGAFTDIPSSTDSLQEWCSSQDEHAAALLHAASLAIQALMARVQVHTPSGMELANTLQEAMDHDITAPPPVTENKHDYAGLAALVAAMQSIPQAETPVETPVETPAKTPEQPEPSSPTPQMPPDTPTGPRVVELLHIEPEASRPPTCFPDSNTNTDNDSVHVDRYGFVYGMTASAYKSHTNDDRVDKASNVSSDGPVHDVEVHTESETSFSDVSTFPLLAPTRATTAASVFSVSQSVRSDAEPALAALPSQSVRRLLQHMHDMYDRQQAERRTQWDAFLTRNTEDTLPAYISEALPKRGTPDWDAFQKLCQGGVPMVYRAAVWSQCVGAADVAEPGRYTELCAGEPESQIELDVRRTMPNNLFFGGDGPGVPKLRRVLAAYARYDPASGYCQGMNNLAAVLLLVFSNEQDAFWAFAGIVHKVLPLGYYGEDMSVAHADQQVLLDLVRSGLPKLMAHIESLGIELRAVTIGWFLSLFTTCLPIETLLRVWDVLFVEGNVVLFRVAFAILHLKAPQLLATSSDSGFYARLHMLASHMFDADEILQTCNALRATIRADEIAMRRRKHLAVRMPRASPRAMRVGAMCVRFQSSNDAPPADKPSVAPAGTVFTGLSILKDKPDPVALPDSEYPPWLFELLEDPAIRSNKSLNVGDVDTTGMSKGEARVAVKRAAKIARAEARRKAQAEAREAARRERLKKEGKLTETTAQAVVDQGPKTPGELRAAELAQRRSLRKNNRAAIKANNFVRST
ncbi:hypothetical protein MCUN1_000199 [Malassezia cuniculi]|uniref:Rab-GAP TBC domain-containing protein n=1 Tax=Malassezia cuniculi TaxID=948313 RepID=A0AAF0ERG4_9BASI|nr:hypothetical protein MCUN1_000199 [Malassezia cuniculi]